jgi:hypothetical protein
VLTRNGVLGLIGIEERYLCAQIIAGLADGSVDLVVGTHALISDSVEFQNLGFAVVDEQHRQAFPLVPPDSCTASLNLKNKKGMANLD